MINIDELRSYSNIKIIGHRHVDFDSMVSGYLLENIFLNLGIKAQFVLQDKEEDIFFKEKFIGRKRTWRKRDDDVLFLVDHTAKYDIPVVGCFDHHPEIVHIEKNYINEPKTSCAKVIYDWAQSIGYTVPNGYEVLTVYACYMDSLSFKSTKARPEDLEWCKEMMRKHNMDENEVVNFGYGLTPKTKNFAQYIKTGVKTYPLGDKVIKSSYIVVDKDEEDENQIVATLRAELNKKTLAWCFIISNVIAETTKILLVTQDYYLVRTVDKLLSRGKNIIPAVMTFLSAKNDGTVTKTLIEKQLEIATMESCTSGLIASNITDYEGASAILEGSEITYSNKTKILAGVSSGIITAYGVYSPETAFDMAQTVKKKFMSDIGIGITGSFGNLDPANPDSVAGVIYYTINSWDAESSVKLVYNTTHMTRKDIKQKTVDIVLATLQTTFL